VKVGLLTDNFLYNSSAGCIDNARLLEMTASDIGYHLFPSVHLLIGGSKYYYCDSTRTC